MPARVQARRKVAHALPCAEVKGWADRMLATLDLLSAELSILLTHDDEMKTLNREYRGEDRATDVLAFAMREGDRLPGAERVDLLGDVVISIETADRQAKRAGRDLRTEARALLAHGLLHLIGFDHGTRAKLSRMRALARELCCAAVGSGRGV